MKKETWLYSFSGKGIIYSLNKINYLTVAKTFNIDWKMAKLWLKQATIIRKEI